MVNNITDKETRFEYTYSASKNHNMEEVEAIRKKYLPVAEDKLKTLRKLDRSVERQGIIVSLSQGIVGTIVLGIGIHWIGNETSISSILGTMMGILGTVLIVCTYLVFKKTIQKQKDKVASQILELCEELSIEEN